MSLGLLTRVKTYQAIGLKNQLMKKELEGWNQYLPSNTYLQRQLDLANARIAYLEAKLKERTP